MFDRNERDARTVSVLRQGKYQTVSTEWIVVGDVIKLSYGMEVPADCILIEGDLTVNEAEMTGEPDDLKKSSADEQNIAFGPDPFIYERSLV